MIQTIPGFLGFKPSFHTFARCDKHETLPIGARKVSFEEYEDMEKLIKVDSVLSS